MIAGLAWKIRNGPAWRNGVKSSANDEIEAKRKDAGPGEDEVAYERWHIPSVFNRREVGRARGKPIVEGFPGEARSAEFFKKRFMNRGIHDAGFHIAPKKQRERPKSI